MIQSVQDVYQSTCAWARLSHLDCFAEDSCGSTNDWAKNQASKNSSTPALYLTASQLQGRGRGTHTWTHSEMGHALYSSWSWVLTAPPQPITSPLIGLALYQAAMTAWPSISWSLKAPNDLYVEDKKIAGLLIEVVQVGQEIRIIVGLGFNVLSSPSSITTATFLTSEIGLGGPLDQTSWFEFLTHFHRNQSKTWDISRKNELPPAEKIILLKALNANPLQKTAILDLSPEGDLITEKGIIRWQDL